MKRIMRWIAIVVSIICVPFFAVGIMGAFIIP